jgi:hypothetical protein
MGHLYLVRSQLQNGVDAAALAGAHTLDGTVAGLTLARTAAQRIAGGHNADGTVVALDLNPGNAAGGDIVLGHWHLEGTPPWFEAAVDPTVAPTWINAVQTAARRTAATGNPVRSWLAQLVGFATGDVAAKALGIGGGPQTACGFPIAVPDCLVEPGGSSTTMLCGVHITLLLRNDTNDNAAFTNLQSIPPVSNSVVLGLVGDARNGKCNAPPGGGNIYLQNGNDLSPIGKQINDWIAQNGGPITVTVPIIQTGLSSGACNPKFNKSFPVAGYAQVKIFSVTPPGGKSGNTMDIMPVCNGSEPPPAGCGFYGDKTSEFYLAQ